MKLISPFDVRYSRRESDRVSVRANAHWKQSRAIRRKSIRRFKRLADVTLSISHYVVRHESQWKLSTQRYENWRSTSQGVSTLHDVLLRFVEFAHDVFQFAPATFGRKIRCKSGSPKVKENRSWHLLYNVDYERCIILLRGRGGGTAIP